MKKSLLLFFICISSQLLAQKTDLSGANLSSQAQINEYGANNYEVTSSLIISGSDITDLSPLSSITTVIGDLSIFSCPNLISLNGLDNIASVGGLLIIVNDMLDNVDALSNLTTATFYINIVLNPMLTSVAGLDNLETISEGHSRGDLDISNNPLLTTISLSNLKHTKELWIFSNASLTSLPALPSLESPISERVLIANNPILSDCSALCSLLSANLITGDLTISCNAMECFSEVQIQENCTPSGKTNYILTTQTAIDNFKATNGNPSTISGYVFISNEPNNMDPITNLGGLDEISSIENGLYIGYTELTNLVGLGTLTSVGNKISICSNNLMSLDGLQNLQEFTSDEIEIRLNGQLSDFCALQNLAQMNSGIEISASQNAYNPTKEQIADPVTCKAPTLSNNTNIEENDFLKVYPNPVSDQLTIKNLKNTRVESIQLFSASGTLLKNFPKQEMINLSNFSSGLYFLNISTAQGSIIKKIQIK